MSSQGESTADASSTVKLPPISFVSDSASKTGAHSPSGSGISSLLSIQNSEEPATKKVKFDGNGPEKSQTAPESSTIEPNLASSPKGAAAVIHAHNTTPRHHHHHHHHFNQPATEPIPHVHKGNHIHLVTKSSESVHKHSRRPPFQLNKEAINDIIKALYPARRHLGSLVYNPTTTWLTLQTSQLTGLKDEHFEKFEELREAFRDKLRDEYFAKAVKFIPVIPPFPADYINYLLEIKIPFRFIKFFREQMELGEIKKKREAWGGVNGVYTDDSDILTVITHLGFFDDNIDLSDWNTGWTKDDIIVPEINKKNDIKGDLSVTILLLPPLDEYHGFQANGINSRSWTEYNRHNGLSYAVYNIKWETEGSYLQDKAFFKRYQTELAYDLKYMKQHIDSKEGWQFDVKYYKALKDKFSKIEPPNAEAKKAVSEQKSAPQPDN